MDIFVGVSMIVVLLSTVYVIFNVNKSLNESHREMMKVYHEMRKRDLH